MAAYYLGYCPNCGFEYPVEANWPPLGCPECLDDEGRTFALLRPEHGWAEREEPCEALPAPDATARA
jgi:hypothetical protein